MYMVTPPHVAPTTGRLLVIGSLVVGLAMSVGLFWIVGAARSRWAALLVVAAAWIVALGWGAFGRFLTVGASGASMSGLVLPVAPVLLVVQLGTAALTVRLLNPPSSGS